tara:strand:- start:214 stop:480 length:267 start_codon:yes stop_codon:yes gene_type:complete
MTKNMMLKAVSEFFTKHKVEKMDLATYKSHGSDVPVKDFLLRRNFGSWNRVLSCVNHRFPVSVAPVVEKTTPAPKPKAKVKVEKQDGK